MNDLRAVIHSERLALVDLLPSETWRLTWPGRRL